MVSQQTRVFQLAAAEAAALEKLLTKELPADAQWRRVPHARFSVKSLGVVATCYRSGKLVLQGGDPDQYSERFLGRVDALAAKSAPPGMAFDQPTIGSDEAGKGDYFGPLAVAAVHACPADAETLRKIGVADSKSLTDARVLKLAGQIEHLLDHEIVALDPPAYNSAYAELPNLNSLLARLHAQALAPLIRRHQSAGVLVDQFARAEVLERELRKVVSPLPEVLQRPKAEAHLAVAAASILARAAFLEGLKQCQDSCGSDLHKGAGSPVDDAAARVVEIGGLQLLESVAKMHFKNTGKLPGNKA